jgi:RNA polymerase sigma factor (sigma-70 family)
MPHRNAFLSPPVPSDAPVFGATVHIVDDDASFRTALERRLRRAGFDVATYPTAQQLLNDLCDQSGLGCIILDVRMPGLSGPELQTRLVERGSTLPILFITGYPDVPTVVSTMKAGAEDFLTKPINSQQLLQAVEGAIAHHKASREVKAKLDVLRSHLAKLTPRERQVFELVVRGETNKQIAYQLGPTERTIKAHRQRIMQKMAVQSLAELVSAAEHLGALSGYGSAGADDQPMSETGWPQT